MTTMALPAFNSCMLAGYAEIKLICRTYKEGFKIAEISILVPGEKGSYKIFTTGDLAVESARQIKPEDFIMCFGRGTSTKSGNKFCIQALRIVDYGKEEILLECMQTETRNDEMIAYFSQYFKNIEVVRGGSVAIQGVSIQDK